LTPSYGAKFLNNTNAAITSLTVTYIGETWRVGNANRSDKIDFQYSTNANDLVLGLILIALIIKTRLKEILLVEQLSIPRQKISPFLG
jgi:hypothetical protein